MDESWSVFFNAIKEKGYYRNLLSFIDKEYQSFTCYPPKELMFNAFELTPLNKVKVVIIGQDPYHEKGQAMGLSFSVPQNIKIPPSLVNIYKEIKNEYGEFSIDNGDLTYLANQGVLLLNAILSVREGKPLSHNIEEYRLFLEDVLNVLDKSNQPIVFMLWGGWAKKLSSYIKNKNHKIIYSNHPSPLSANRGGWFNTNIFKECNEFLEKNNLLPINWTKVL